MPKRKKADNVQVGLRLSAHLRDKLAASASDRSTSLNAEIVRRIEDSFRDEQRAEDIRKAVVAELCAHVGGERQFRQLMALGQHLDFFATDIAARLPADDTTEFTAAVIQIPTVEETRTPGFGNFTVHSVRLARRDAEMLGQMIDQAVSRFYREKST